MLLDSSVPFDGGDAYLDELDSSDGPRLSVEGPYHPFFVNVGEVRRRIEALTNGGFVHINGCEKVLAIGIGEKTDAVIERISTALQSNRQRYTADIQVVPY